MDIRLMAGALIRVVGNRFAWHVKDAMLESLVLLLTHTGELVKNFLPQLQTIFMKGLRDESRPVRMRSAVGLSKLMVYSKRVDPVVADLVTVIEESTRGTPTDDDLEIAEAMIKALEGVMARGGSVVTKPQLVSSGQRLRAILQNLEKELSSKPQTIVLKQHVAIALGVHAEYLDDEAEGGYGFASLFAFAAQGLQDLSPPTRHARLLLLSALIRFCGPRLLPQLKRIVSLLTERLGESDTHILASALKTCGYLFRYAVSVPNSEEFEIASKLFTPMSVLCTHADFDVKLAAVLALQSAGRAHGLFKVFVPFFPSLLPPLVDLASHPRGYPQIRSEAEKAIVLLMGDRRLETRLEEALNRCGVPRAAASTVAAVCRNKDAVLAADAEEVEHDDFLSTI